MAYKLCIKDGRVAVVFTEGQKSLPLSELLSNLVIGVFPEVAEGEISPSDTIVEALLKLEYKMDKKTDAVPVATYAAMTALGTPGSATYYKVAVDENKGINNSYYLWWPDGKRIWIAATDDN